MKRRKYFYKHIVITVRNAEELQIVGEERIIVKIIKIRKANWIGHIFHRNCLLKHVIEGKIDGRVEVAGRRRRKRKLLIDKLKKKTGYCKLREEAIDRTVWRTHFGRGCGLCVSQNYRMNE
jgi:hypothetical protein